MTEPAVCSSCRAVELVAMHAWSLLSPDEREARRQQGQRPGLTRGVCCQCAKRGDRPPAKLDTRATEQRIEDLEWMNANGESLVGAAQRLGIAVSALENFCERHNRRDLTRALRARNPCSIANSGPMRWSA